MKGRYTLSPRAQLDIEEIWNHTAVTWDIDQAESYIRQLEQHIEALAEQPAMGRACAEIRSGYYKYPSGSHILFYRLLDGGIDIVRILHSRMDFEQHL